MSSPGPGAGGFLYMCGGLGYHTFCYGNKRGKASTLLKKSKKFMMIPCDYVVAPDYRKREKDDQGTLGRPAECVPTLASSPSPGTPLLPQPKG